MKLDIRINNLFEVDVPLEDLIEEINNQDMIHRFNTIAALLNGIEVNPMSLDEKQKALVISYLQKKLNQFNAPDSKKD